MTSAQINENGCSIVHGELFTAPAPGLVQSRSHDVREFAVFNRPGLAGAVLQTPLSMIH